MRVRKTTNTNGFTIVELLIATVVFSMVLLLLATSIVQVGRIFYKGTTINRTQDTARAVADDIAQSLQFGVTDSGNFYRTEINNYGGASGVDVRSICIGEDRYNYSLNTSLGNAAGQTPHVLWKDRVSLSPNCPTLDLQSATQPDSVSGQELLAENMRIPILTVSLVPGSNLWKIDLSIAYGPTIDVFAKKADGTTDFSKCASTGSGGQFCAVSSISTSVTKRL